MTEIVKICQKHGPLIREQIYEHSRKDRPGSKTKKCRLCHLEKNTRYREKNRAKLSVSTKDWQNKNREHYNAWAREHRKSNPKKYSEAQKKYRRQNAEKIYLSSLKYLYDIEPSEYQKVLAAQNDLCAICKQPEIRRSRTAGKVSKLMLDHCHKTAKFRGLLCHTCNIGIGSFKDSIELMEEAIQYLKEHKD